MIESRYQTNSLTRKQRTSLLKRIRKLVLEHHVNVAGASYEVWARTFDERTTELLAADMEHFEEGIRQLLSELGTSHTVLYKDQGIRLLPQHSINATLRRFSRAGWDRWMFLDVFEGGPADTAGIRPGDLLLALNDRSCEAPSVPQFAAGAAHKLQVSDINGGNSRELLVNVPYRRGSKQRPPIIEPKSITHRMISPEIGLLRITYFPGAMGMRFARLLDTAIAALKKEGCDRLIIDLRGNIGGSLGFARLASYLCPGEVLIGNSITPRRLRKPLDRSTLPQVPMPKTMLGLALTLARFLFRDKSVALLTQGLGNQPFHRRIVVIVNEWTNSAAEMLAAFASENGLAWVVGDGTAGNVLGAMNFKIGHGYWLRLPVFGWHTSHGDCLEGKGVVPDVMVEVDPALLNAGIDQQMEKAIEILRGATPTVKGIATGSVLPVVTGPER
jgi:C-terminal processing protease CtpA/Prc